MLSWLGHLLLSLMAVFNLWGPHARRRQLTLTGCPLILYTQHGMYPFSHIYKLIKNKNKLFPGWCFTQTDSQGSPHPITGIDSSYWRKEWFWSMTLSSQNFFVSLVEATLCRTLRVEAWWLPHCPASSSPLLVLREYFWIVTYTLTQNLLLENLT